jgi:hypothetical protein
MASYVKFELDDGTIVYLESTDSPKGASGLIPGGREHAEMAAVSFDQSVASIRKMAVTLMQNLRSGFSEQPDEVGVSFGIKASGEIGNLVISRGGMEANYNVSLRWRNKDKEKEKEEGSEDHKKDEETGDHKKDEGTGDKDEAKKPAKKGAASE